MRIRLLIAFAVVAMVPSAAMARDISQLVITNESPMPFTVAPDYNGKVLRVLPQEQRPQDSVVVGPRQQTVVNINNGSWEMTGDGGDVKTFYVNKGHEYHFIISPFRQGGTVGLTGTLDDGYNSTMVVLYRQRDNSWGQRPPPPPPGYGQPQYYDPRLNYYDDDDNAGAEIAGAIGDLVGSLLHHDDGHRGPPPPPPPPRRHGWDGPGRDDGPGHRPPPHHNRGGRGDRW